MKLGESDKPLKSGEPGNQWKQPSNQENQGTKETRRIR